VKDEEGVLWFGWFSSMVKEVKDEEGVLWSGWCSSMVEEVKDQEGALWSGWCSSQLSSSVVTFHHDTVLCRLDIV
jgi:hypothetical protein